MKHFLSVAVLLAFQCSVAPAEASTIRHSIESLDEITSSMPTAKRLEVPKKHVFSAPILSAEGERQNYISSNYWANAIQDMSNFTYDEGLVATIIYDNEDSSVYLDALVPSWQEGLLKGEAKDGVLIFQSDQLVSEWGVGNIYIGAATYDSKTDEYSLIESYSFSKSKETGDYILNDTESGQRVYIVVYLENGMLIRLLYQMTLSPFNETTAIPPSDAKIEKKVLTHFDDINKYPYKGVIKTVTKGNEIWLEGFSGATTGYVKGEILEDGSIRIPSGQLTVAYTGTHINYMYTASKSAEDGHFYPTDAIILTKNGDTYSSEPQDYIRYGYNEGSIDYQYKNFIVEPYDMTMRKPAAPYIRTVDVVREGDLAQGHEPGEIYMEFVIPSECVEGKLLDPNCMSWRLYLDDKLYTFSPSSYSYLEKDLTEIPYTYSDYNDIIFLGFHILYLKTKSVAKVGIESVYTMEDGRMIASDIAEKVVNINVGLSEVRDIVPVKTEWYDLQGRKVVAPSSGMFIKTDIYPDGEKINTLTIK